MTLDTNPYAPPQADPTLNWPVLPPERWADLRLEAALVTRRSMQRVIALTGSLSAEVHYDARGLGERVLVNGRIQARSSLWYFSLVAPTIDFFVAGDGFVVPARIEVRAGPSLWTIVRLARFRLIVAGRVMYEE